MKIYFYLILILSPLFLKAQSTEWNGPGVDLNEGKLRVSSNQRFLEFESGKPFFYLGDTAWELFHRLGKEDTDKYLENRRKKGFTVIQAVALAELDGLNTPNVEGEVPLINNDVDKPNEKYFKHVDWVIKKAEEKGMFIGLLPTWGDKVDKQWGVGPVIFTKDNAYRYGAWIANRYKNSKNIIWIVGGDRVGSGSNFEIFNAMANGIKSGDENHLMTFHPMGINSSSGWFHNEDWLDFNMMQSGHSDRSYSVYKKFLTHDYNLKPTKPTFDGEPRYENHPVDWKPEVLGWFDEVDVRQAAYWSLFSGSFGHTYGCHSIWQMLTPERKPISFARHPWYDDLNLPGASQMLFVRRLMESRPMNDRVPFQDIIANGYISETDYVVGVRGKDFVFIYLPTGIGIDLNLGKLDWKTSAAWWFNPKTGKATKIGEVQNTGTQTFKPENSGRGNDWILVLDNKNSSFSAPGE